MLSRCISVNSTERCEKKYVKCRESDRCGESKLVFSTIYNTCISIQYFVQTAFKPLVSLDVLLLPIAQKEITMNELNHQVTMNTVPEVVAAREKLDRFRVELERTQESIAQIDVSGASGVDESPVEIAEKLLAGATHVSNSDQLERLKTIETTLKSAIRDQDNLATNAERLASIAESEKYRGRHRSMVEQMQQGIKTILDAAAAESELIRNIGARGFEWRLPIMCFGPCSRAYALGWHRPERL